MFHPQKLSVLLVALSLVLFVGSVWADICPIEGDVTFTGRVPPTTTWTYVGFDGDGNSLTGRGQHDYDFDTGEITNGMFHVDWDDGSFSIDITFQGQTMPDGTFEGTWEGGGLSGTLSGTTDFHTVAHSILECN